MENTLWFHSVAVPLTDVVIEYWCGTTPFPKHSGDSLSEPVVHFSAINLNVALDCNQIQMVMAHFSITGDFEVKND